MRAEISNRVLCPECGSEFYRVMTHRELCYCCNRDCKLHRVLFVVEQLTVEIRRLLNED